MDKLLTIEGLDEFYRAMDDMPAAAVKITKTALRAAATPVARNLRKATPERWRKLVRSKVISGTTTRGGLSATVGLWNLHQISEKGDREDWFKAYWANYGTLKHRDPQHEFAYPIKPHLKRRNEEGQPAQNFFEKGSENAANVFLQKFSESFEKNQDKLLKK